MQTCKQTLENAIIAESNLQFCGTLSASRENEDKFFPSFLSNLAWKWCNFYTQTHTHTHSPNTYFISLSNTHTYTFTCACTHTHIPIHTPNTQRQTRKETLRTKTNTTTKLVSFHERTCNTFTIYKLAF